MIQTKMTTRQLLVVMQVLGILTGQSISQQRCEYPPCSTVPDHVTYYYPHWDDCSTFWRCHDREATKQQCPPGQVFDFYTFQCRPRPTHSTIRSHPVLSCDLLLHGLDGLDPHA